MYHKTVRKGPQSTEFMEENMMKKRLMLTLAVILALSMVMSGCGAGNNAPVEPKEAAKAEEKVPDKAQAAPTEIKFMHWWSYVNDDVMKAFKDENPDIQLNMEYVAIDQYPNKLKMLAASSETPDVFGAQSQTFAEFAKQKKLMDLSDILKQPAYDKATAWGETIQTSLMTNVASQLPTEFRDKAYGVPFGAISVAVVYNKNIFDKVGITVPKTWDEFLSNNDKLKEAGVIPLSFTGKVWGDWWYRMALDQTMRDAKAEDFAAGNVKFTDAGFVDALKIVQDMWKRGHFDPGGFSNGIEETQALFVQGKLAQFYVVPENFVTYLINNSPKDVKLDAFALPAMKGVTPNRGLGGAPNIVAISAETKAKDAAVKLAKYMVSEKVFQALAPQNVVPSTVGYTPPAGNPIMKAYADASSGGFMTEQTPLASDSKLKDKLDKELYPRLLLKGESPEAIAKELQAFYEKNKK